MTVPIVRAVDDATALREIGQWRIKSSKLTRVREDVFNALFSFYISDRVRKVLMNVARRVVK